jgi:hypothetical protein
LNWYILTVTASRETQVEAHLARLGFETYQPLEPRFTSISRHSPRRKVLYTALIPRAVFVRDNGTEMDDLTSIRHVRGIARNALGEPWIATHREMVQFKAALENWTQSLLKGRKQPVTKPTPIKLGDMSRMSEIMRLMFGIEEVTE